jgi:hypothetical protein
MPALWTATALIKANLAASSYVAALSIGETVIKSPAPQDVRQVRLPVGRYQCSRFLTRRGRAFCALGSRPLPRYRPERSKSTAVPAIEPKYLKLGTASSMPSSILRAWVNLGKHPTTIPALGPCCRLFPLRRRGCFRPKTATGRPQLRRRVASSTKRSSGLWTTSPMSSSLAQEAHRFRPPGVRPGGEILLHLSGWRAKSKGRCRCSGQL